MTVTPGSPAGPDGSRAPAAGPGPRSRGSVAEATLQLCPYLTMDDGGWRSAAAAREQRCGALAPPASLALEKQRRLCLAAAHTSCATYRAAGGLATFDEPAAPPARAPGPDAGATRWVLGRTAPVVLDHGRIASVAVMARRRTGPQLALGGLMALALAAIILARLPAAGDPALVGGLASPGPASIPAPTVTPRPTPRLTPTPSSSAGPSTSASPGPASTPTPAASTPPTAAPSATTAAPSATTAPGTPTAPPVRTYVVRAGDTLYDLSIRFGTTIKAIQDLNRLGSSTAIRVGQVLRIP